MGTESATSSPTQTLQETVQATTHGALIERLFREHNEALLRFLVCAWAPSRRPGKWLKRPMSDC